MHCMGDHGRSSLHDEIRLASSDAAHSVKQPSVIDMSGCIPGEDDLEIAARRQSMPFLAERPDGPFDICSILLS